MSAPRGGSIAGNFSRLARALRSAADGFEVEEATFSIASIRPLSQTVLCSNSGRPIGITAHYGTPLTLEFGGRSTCVGVTDNVDDYYAAYHGEKLPGAS